MRFGTAGDGDRRSRSAFTSASHGIGARTVKSYRDTCYAVVVNSRNTTADEGVLAVSGNISDS
jgi:hypothetical protein